MKRTSSFKILTTQKALVLALVAAAPMPLIAAPVAQTAAPVNAQSSHDELLKPNASNCILVGTSTKARLICYP